ncbi:MAG TPA: hypothetical protein DCG71_07755 [Brevundimonas sp.]|nr:hypothetical protein [Brevundimonas sp.]
MTRMRFSFIGLAVVLGSAALAACSAPQLQAPSDKGVCYHVGEPAGGEPRFNVVARDQPQIEFCAARLEEMRLKFLSMGGSNNEMVGAYQGQFIFIDRTGVKFSKSLDGPRFFALARTGDGRLAIPGAIQRQMDGRPIAVAPN